MFLVLAAPTVFLIGATMRLPHPRRGGTSGAAAAREHASPLPFREARRMLFAIPSMRRLYFGAFLLGSGFLTLPTVSALFFEDIYGFTPLLRGIQAFLPGAGTLAGLASGQRPAIRALAPGTLPRLATIPGPFFPARAVGH